LGKRELHSTGTAFANIVAKQAHPALAGKKKIRCHTLKAQL
jgi:hypothetical protein